MIKKFLLPLSVVAMMMSGAISGTTAYAQDKDSAVQALEAVVEEPELDYASNELKFGNFLYTVSREGNVTIKGLADPNISNNINLEIPAAIEGSPVTEIAANAFRGNANIKSVKLSEGLVKIGQGAFTNCVNITGELIIPSTVTTVDGGSRYYDDGAFQGTSISSVTILDGTAAITLGTHIFKDCRALQTVTLSGRVSSIEHGCFLGDMSLETVVFSESGQPLIIGNEAFMNTTLTSLKLPDTVTSIGESAFKQCLSLEKVVMGKNVGSIGRDAFYGSTALAEITLNEGLKTIGAGAFGFCSSFGGKLVIPSTVEQIDGGSIWDTKGAFQSTSITELEIKDSDIPLQISYNVFRDCKSLVKVSFPGRLKLIDAQCFQDDSNLKTINFVDGNNGLAIGEKAFYQTAVENVVFPNNTESIGNFAFENCALLKEISLNEGLLTIGRGAFVNCKNLTCELVIPSTVTEIGGGYYWEQCGAFENTGIWSVTIKEGNAGIDIGNTAFRGCTNLRFAQLSNRVKSIGQYAFANNYKLAWVRISNGVYECQIQKEAFANDTYLKALVIPRMAQVGSNVATGCTKLKDIYYAANTNQYNNYVKVDSANEVYLAAGMHYESEGPSPMPEITYTGWDIVGDKKFWYENDELQGYDANNPYYRGKEICDPASDAWYWLDNIQGGAMAVSKDVYQESYAGPYADREDGTGKWVRYDENGHMIKGFDKTKEGTYYFDPIYGAMVKGLQVIEGSLYYFDPITGIMQTGAVNINGYEYAFASDGTALDKQWYNIDGKLYWYENGVRQGYDPNNPWYRGKEIYDESSDAWYWLDNVQGGAKAVSKDVFQEADGGKWVRYDSRGRMIKGWASYKKYYFDLVTGAMYKGWHTIDGINYYFNEVTGERE